MSDYTAGLKNIDDLDEDIRIAFVVGEFNREYTSRLEKDNREFLAEQGFENTETFFVPGAFEIPAFTKKLLENEDYDLVITLGVVIRGATPHFDYVCGESSRAIMDLTLAYDTPIIFGILTCNTVEQVEERMGHGFAISGLNLLAELEKIQ
ncbi:6,7-dimethyl-8-ribityllumazine synthase [Candidatus Gracilibacteria bacterium]|nr:6,7-dimethyl-8-ribityllumazine synthase [Candidatus Gracilibacteria bacterium]